MYSFLNIDKAIQTKNTFSISIKIEVFKVQEKYLKNSILNTIKILYF